MSEQLSITKDEINLANLNGELSAFKDRLRRMTDLQEGIIEDLKKIPVLSELLLDVNKIHVDFDGEDMIDIAVKSTLISFTTKYGSLTVSKRLSEIAKWIEKLIEEGKLSLSESEVKTIKHDLSRGSISLSVKDRIINYYSFNEDDSNTPHYDTICLINSNSNYYVNLLLRGR